MKNFGILWDLDGTLLDTLGDLHAATNAALARFGYPLRTPAEIRRFVGNGARRQIRLSLPESADEAAVDRVLAFYRTHYNAHCNELTRPYPGIPEMLEALKNYPLAIVSNKPQGAVEPLCAAWFPGIPARGETPDCPRKPAPDMLFRAAQDLGVTRFVLVGDSEVDLATAKAAGVPCVSVLWGFRDEDELKAAGARYLCREPADLPKIVEEIYHGQ